MDYLQNELFHAVYGKLDYLKDYNNGIENKDNIALISIHNPDSLIHPHSKIEGFADVLQTQFWDIERSENHNGILKVPLTHNQGTELREFILKNKDKKFIVHCAAGQSRSAGVACAIECLVNFNGSVYDYQTGSSEIKDHIRYSPNYVVFDMIVKDYE